MQIVYCLHFAVLLDATFLPYLSQTSPPELYKTLQVLGVCCISTDFANENISQTQILL